MKQIPQPAPLLAYAASPVAARACTTGTPRRDASSAGAERQFRDACSTQIAFRRTAGAVAVDVDVGTMDQPSGYAPARHLWCQSRLPWLELGDAQPRFPESAGTDPAG